MGASREPVFVARNSAEEAAAERALDAAAIAYTVTVEATGKSDGAVCFLSIVYEVSAGDAARARAVLDARGLHDSILPPRG